jgi:antitoxin (DNA-binding transcriptional repressor) of toxin-antitoxin stability system
MRIISLEESQTNLPQLMEEMARGESLIITKGGSPLAQVTSLRRSSTKPRIGFATRNFTVPDDFNTMGADEILALFEGEE